MFLLKVNDLYYKHTCKWYTNCQKADKQLKSPLVCKLHTCTSLISMKNT